MNQNPRPGDNRDSRNVAPASAPQTEYDAVKATMPLGTVNFIAMGICAVLIIAGFVLMLGPGSTPEAFNADIFSTRRIVVGPLLAFLGFVAMAVAIIIKPRQKK